jgi:LysM repeat protein
MKKLLPIFKLVLPMLISVVLLQAVNGPAMAAPPAEGGFYHTVHYGDTLFSIGRMYGVNPYTIAEVNGLSNPDCIYAGQILYIPSGGGWGGGGGCGRSGCGNTPRQQPQPRYTPRYDSGYGYDYTGYYYYNTYPQYRRYSYTCGYYYNCY